MDDAVPGRLAESKKTAAAAAGSSRKRPHEHDEELGDRETDKMFKCNYWEDPAYAHMLQHLGLHLARTAALSNHVEETLRVAAAWRAARGYHLMPPDQDKAADC